MLRRTRIAIKKTFAEIGLLSVEVIIIWIAFFISLFVFTYMVKAVFIDREAIFDQAAFSWLGTHISSRNTAFMQFITFLGTHKFLIPANIILTAYFLFVRKHRWYSIKVASIALSSTAMMFLLKTFFSRERPLIPLLQPAMGYSFPSGHSMMSFAFYGLLIYLAYRYVNNQFLKWLLIITFAALILLIGVSRIYLRVHYATDVLAGFSVGLVWLVFSIWMLNRLERFSKRTIEPVVEEETSVTI
jgi:membrane-associated phospholipid phosphatase